MHFIFISQKNEESQLNEELLRKNSAPSLISREAIKLNISNFIIYLYPYNDINPENWGNSYYADENNVFICNGLVNYNQKVRKQNICEFFNYLDNNNDLLGDYQLISIDKNGNGFLKTPPLSIKQLFFYEDENCEVLSTEIKLIVDGIQKFRGKKFIKNFDIEFMEDSVFREWNIREFPRNTIFKNIKRVFPNDLKYFKNGRIIIDKKESIKPPLWFINKYNENKKELYDEYYQILLNFIETNLILLKNKIDKIDLGLTGGFDSRLSAAILAKLCKTQNIKFECATSGQINHPDVILAKKIAKVLDVPHKHNLPQNNVNYNTTKYEDYKLTFYISQGDFNSKDFVKKYNREISSNSILAQLGMDGFKRHNMDKIYSGNRWFARRILFHKNYFLPLFFTKYETWFALLYGEQSGEYYKEFVYEILKRAEPKLLKIPFAGDSLPQTNIKPYLTKKDSTHHEKEPFFWDYKYVQKNLKPVFEKKFKNNIYQKGRLFLNILGINELDYFINPEIHQTLKLYNKKQISLKKCIKNLIKERFSGKYPRSKQMLEITKERNPYTTKLQILMDFASVANNNSFEEIERIIKLHKI